MLVCCTLHARGLIGVMYHAFDHIRQSGWLRFSSCSPTYPIVLVKLNLLVYLLEF